MRVPARQRRPKTTTTPGPEAKSDLRSSPTISPMAMRTPTSLQPKLTVNSPGDRYEQEADRVADQVMRMPDPELQRQPLAEEEEEDLLQMKPIAGTINPLMQRQTEPIEEEAADEEEFLQAKAAAGEPATISSGLQNQIMALQGGGQPLSPSERHFFEPRFGTDFSQVRIHTDDQAAEAARAVKARAFTLGRNVVFGTGQYQQRSGEGKRLLAHELTHVVQQSSGIPISGGLGIKRDVYQGQADTVADSEAAGHSGKKPLSAYIDTGGNRPLLSSTIQCLRQELPYVGPLLSYLNPVNQLNRAFLPGLSRHQKDLLDNIFGNSLATSIIRLNPNSILATGNCYRTTGNIINMPGTTISDSHLIHEAAHVWQSQNTIFGVGYAVSALKAMAIAEILGGNWQRAYDYKKVEKYMIPWRFWNAEQQASWIEDNRRLPSGWMLEGQLPNFGIESAGIE